MNQPLHLDLAFTHLAHAFAQRLLRAIRAALKAHAAHRRRQQRAADTSAALRMLDARTLHDLGLHCSEIDSVAAEVSGATHPTRLHSLASRPSH